jgi:hypothetical protein
VALVSSLFIGCEAEPMRLGSLSEGNPAVLEPGYAVAPPTAKWLPRDSTPSCRGTERTSESPAIEIISSGGIGGGGFGNMQIWEDGTVLFDGVGCPGGSRRRGKMSPARVRALIDKLEDARFFMWPCDDEARCDDSFITSLTLQHGGAEHTVVHAGCDSNVAAKAIELVMKTVGKNACSPWCLDDPVPTECQ